MHDFYIWTQTKETQEVVKELVNEIEKAKNEILDFGGLMTSPHLEREYCRALGYLDGLKFLKRYLEERAKNDDDSNMQTISRTG
jgi:hypothetical protein